MKVLCLIGTFFVFQLLTLKVSAQTDSVYWNFGTTGSATPYASFSTNVNVLATACMADTGNVHSTGLGTSVYTPIYLTDQFPSTGTGTYTGASGEPTLRNNATTGSFNATTSTWFGFSVTPGAGYYVTIKSISFGGGRIATGPSQYTIRTSADAYASNIGTGTLGSNTYSGAKKSHTGLNVVGTAGTPLVVRIYSHNAIGTATGGNVYLDDITITYTVTLAGCSGAPSHATASAVPGSFCGSGSSGLSLTGASSGTGISYQWYQSATGLPGSFSLINTATASTYTTPTLSSTTYYYCITTCSNSSLKDTSSIATVTVNPAVIPSVTISSNAPSNTTCTGTLVTFTATPANGGTTPAYQWKKNGSNVGTNSTTYTDNTLITGDIISCIMTSNASCASPTIDTSNIITMTVNANFTPSVSISAAPSGPICAGTSVTFTAAGVNGPSNITLINALTCTLPTTATTSCVNGFFASGWTAGTQYWQYQVSTLGYQNIVFSTPTSSSATGPHNGTAYYSTDGVNFNLLTNYSFSGTGCTSTGNIILPAAADNKAAVYVRLIMTGASNVGGTNRVNSANTFKGNLLPTATPSYQWKKNGSNVGTNSTTYTDNGLSNGDVVTCVMTSNAACASSPTATSNSITMTVNPLVTPSVTISSNAPSNTICAGTSVTFMAAPVNGGSTPAYQWKKNGSNVGANSATYTDNSLVNGDAITCVLTSNATCATPATATSNTVTMTVNPIAVPSVSISSNAPLNTICSGAIVIFTATPTNGGATPSYQWKKNGNNIGTDNTTYTDNGLSNGDIITCVLTSNAVCASPATTGSNSITMTVNAVVTPSVTISSNAPANTVCAGGTVTFTSVPVNGGAAPAYQWKKNGSNVGTNSTTYIDNALVNGDVITCELTSNATCASLTTAGSNSITMTVNPNVTPSVSISSNAALNTLCAGTMVTFTATPVNEGAAPVYQWKKNGISVGINSATYTDNSLANGDVVTCEMTSNAPCAAPAVVTGNTLNMTVNPVVTPSVTINPQFTTTCQGAAVSFTAVPVNGGPAPVYQWKVNGNNVATGLVYSNTGTLNNNDIVSVVMTSNATCALPATANASVTMTILPVVTPTVSISANPGNNICAGTSVNFTANTTGGGSAPTYQWYQNGVNVGSGATYNAGTGLANGDIIKLVLKSNVACPMGGIDTAFATTTMAVSPVLTPAVSISSNTGTSTCVGTIVVFTATASNAGSNPTYQWKLNSVNVGTNSSTYTNSALPTGSNTITCTVTSSYTCYSTPTATNTYNITVNPLVTPTITISSVNAPGGAVCAGSNVTFTANTTNAGSGPSYQWKLNGANVGTNSSGYNAGTALATGDVVTCVLTSNAPCTTPSATAVSNAVTITVYPVLPASVTITATIPANQACTGYPDTFKATVVNGGPNPVYQWKKDGNNVGLNKPTYIDSAWIGGIITCEVTSSIPCAMPSPAVSNPITLVANPVIPVMIKIYASPDSIGCDGQGIDFFSYFSNGGQTPQYKWYVNGKFIPGAVQPWFQSKLLNDGDIVTCEFFSSMTCAFSLFSNPVKMHMKPSPVPQVTISGTPNGNSITFQAAIVNGGSSPTYQWRKNTVDIPGATNPTLTLSPYQLTDKISLFLQSSEECANPKFLLSNILDVSKVTGIGHISDNINDLQLQPNPNSGKFTLKGTLSNGGDRQATVEILNSIGQVVFKNTANISGTGIDLPVDISSRVVPGVYMLRLRIDDETSVIRFVLQ